jgi:hypothetical protein
MKRKMTETKRKEYPKIHTWCVLQGGIMNNKVVCEERKHKRVKRIERR